MGFPSRSLGTRNNGSNGQLNVGRALPANGNFFWFPSSRLGTPLQAKLLLCEINIYLLHQVAQAGTWERGKGGMRCAFPPYGLLEPSRLKTENPINLPQKDYQQ